IEERTPRPHRVRPSLRAPDVRRIAAPRSRVLSAAAGGRRDAQRLDERGSNELLGSRADRRPRTGALDGIRPDGLPAAGVDGGEVLEPARRRVERTPAELRKPAVRARADGAAGGAVPARSPVSLDDDRRNRGPRSGRPRGGARVLPPLL